MAELSFVYILGLALVDAINPCALAVMTIVLMEMLLQDPTKRKNVLLGGLAFTLAVFILYFLYGAIIVQFFSYLIPETGNYANYIFRGFGVLAIFLGILNLKEMLFSLAKQKIGGTGRIYISDFEGNLFNFNNNQSPISCFSSSWTHRNSSSRTSRNPNFSINKVRPFRKNQRNGRGNKRNSGSNQYYG